MKDAERYILILLLLAAAALVAIRSAPLAGQRRTTVEAIEFGPHPIQGSGLQALPTVEFRKIPPRP